MSLRAVYERFLADPSPAVLSPDVSLNYVTTTTTIQRADVVISHLSSQKRIAKRKSEKILSAIEGQGSLCLDVETTLEFVSGGGAYLPSLDDNFLIDRLATFPMVFLLFVLLLHGPIRYITDDNLYRSILSVSIRRRRFSRSGSIGTRVRYSS
jgi:hypothetical protein